MSLRDKKLLILIQAAGLLFVLSGIVCSAYAQTTPPTPIPGSAVDRGCTNYNARPPEPGVPPLYPQLPGLPCVVPKTPDAPEITTDGPNQTTAPNDRIRDKNPMCDADLMNQIYAKAFLESNREYIMGQAIIRKPDSILEYTCFDQFVNRAGERAGAMFSETDLWRRTATFRGQRTQANYIDIDGYIGPHPVQGDCAGNQFLGGAPYSQIPTCSDVRLNIYMNRGRLLFDLRRMVSQSLRIYIDNNFDHTFLGGEMTQDYVACDVNYVCNYMNIVYLASKCRDMGVDDPFMSFENLVTLDPRYLPQQCMLDPDPTIVGDETPLGTGFRQDVIDLARNRTASTDFVYVNFDEANNNHLDLSLPDGATVYPGGPVVRCSDPVQTGIKVERVIKNVDARGNVTTTQTQRFNDMVCINPGCSFDFNNGTCVPTAP